MQKGGQHGAPDHNIGEAIGIGSPEALTKTLCALLIVGSVSRLIHSREKNIARDTDYIGGSFESELVLQLLRHRHSAFVVDNKIVGNNAQDSLFLFCLDLLGSELLDREGGDRSLDH